MSLGERIKKARREKNLTQQELGEKLGIKQNSVALIESGKRNASEQVILGVCRVLGINEAWLRDGKGEMLAPVPSDALGALIKERGLTERDRVVIEKLLNLPPELRDGLIDYFCNVAAALAGATVSDDAERGVAIAEADYEKSSGIASNTDFTPSTTTGGTASTG